MNSILRQQRRSSIAAAVVTILLGLFLAFWPGQSVSFLCMLLGAAIALTGVIYFVGWLARRKAGVPALFVLPGVVLFALGAWLMTSPASVVQLVQYIFGAVLIFHGIVDLQGALALMGQGYSRWWVDLLLAVLTLALGVLVVVNPFGTFAALMTLVGLSLVFDGITDLVIIWRLSRAFKDIYPPQKTKNGSLRALT